MFLEKYRTLYVSIVIFLTALGVIFGFLLPNLDWAFYVSYAIAIVLAIAVGVLFSWNGYRLHSQLGISAPIASSKSHPTNQDLRNVRSAFSFVFTFQS